MISDTDPHSVNSRPINTKALSPEADFYIIFLSLPMKITAVKIDGKRHLASYMDGKLDGFMNATNILIAGKNALVAGYGYVWPIGIESGKAFSQIKL